MAKQTKIKANAEKISELNAQTTQHANDQGNANADQHANANAQGQDMTTQHNANADQHDQSTTQHNANADQHANAQIDQGNAQPLSQGQDMTTQNNTNADQIAKKIDQGNANAQDILLSSEDRDLLEKLTNSLASVDLTQAKSIVQTQAKKTEKSSVKREISSVGVDDHQNEITCTSLLCFGQYVKHDDLVKAMREFAKNPVFISVDAQHETDYQRLARLFDHMNKTFKLGFDISMLKSDRIAVNGSKCIDLDDLLIDQFEHGKDSKLSIQIARPELSLGLRLYCQFLNFNAIFDEITNARLENRSVDQARLKTFSVGDSTSFKHISSTVRNLKALININANIAFYDNKSSKTQVMLDFAKSGSDAHTLKALSMLDEDYLSCVVRPNQEYPKAHLASIKARLIFNTLNQPFDLSVGLENELLEIKAMLEKR
jgi:hypothetical protein